MNANTWITFTHSTNGRTYRTNADATVVAYWCEHLQMWVRSISPRTYEAARLKVMQ